MMGRKFKFNDNNYLDSTGIIHGKELLSEILNNLHKQDVLWTGGFYMNAEQSIDLSKTPISKQKNGIVLVFSVYSGNKVQDYDFKTFFIHKKVVADFPGVGHDFFLNTSGFNIVGAKYLYIADTKITGNAANQQTGTGSSGVKYQNNYWVLRYVLGV